MEATGEQEGGSNEDLTGKKKPKLQILKSRLSEKMKRKRNKGVMKQSHSATDIMEGIRNSDFNCSQSMLGSRALSHDSIFLADQCQSDPEPLRVLSQENIHGKIRALQMKLQQQNMHLGPPPLVLPIKRTEDPGGNSEDDGLSHSPPKNLGLTKNMQYKFLIPPRNQRTLSLGTGSEEEEQPSAQPNSPMPISPTLAPVSPSVPITGVDFTTPPQFIPCLDNSAARHRMSIKPRNQRASTKSRRLLTSTGCRPRSESMSNLERPLTESEEEEGAAVTKEMTRVRSYSSQIIRPGEVLTAPPIKSPFPTSPLKSLVGIRDAYHTPAMSQSDRSISPSITSLHHPAIEQQMPTKEAASSQKPEAAITAAGTKQALSSVVPTSQKLSGDLRESPFSSKLKSECTVVTIGSAAHSCPVESEQNQPESEKESNAMSTQDKRDILNKKEVKDTLHQSLSKGQPLVFPQAGGLAVRPPSLRRNTSPLDEKVVSRNLQQISTAPPPAQGEPLILQKEYAIQQKPISSSFHFSASSTKINERNRTGSFSGGGEQVGAKREPVHLSMVNLKTQEKPRSVQIRTAGKDPLPTTESQRNEKATCTPVMPNKQRDPTLTLSSGQERRDRRASETQETGVEATEEEVQEAVEEADEASEDLKENEVNEESKGEDEKNAFGVKLRTTSLSLKFRADKAQSDLKAKQHRSEVSMLSPAWSMESTAPAIKKDTSVGHEVRGNMSDTVLKKSPAHNVEDFISAQVTSSAPQRANRDEERTASSRLDYLRTTAQPSSSLTKGTKLLHSVPKESTPLPLTTKEITQICSEENISTPNAVKEQQETPSEISWMSMAREKTRSLQQLFTSKLPDFASLQTTTRSTNMTAVVPQTQISPLQPSKGPTKPMSQASAGQPRPLQSIFTQPTATQAAVRTTLPTQPPGMKSSIRTPEPTTGPSGVAECSLKQTLTATSQAQTTQLSTKTAQLPTASSAATHSTSKPVQSTAYTPVLQIHTQTVEKQSSQPAAQVQSAIQSNRGSSPPTSCHLSSPKLTSHHTSQGSVSQLSQPRLPIGEDLSSSLRKAGQTPVLQGKGPLENTTQRTGGLGSTALLTKQWENQTLPAAKTEDQKSTTVCQSAPVTAFRAMSSPSKSTEPGASSGSMRLDREDKWQKKTEPPSPPTSSSSPPLPPLQSIPDSGQPSWMELAKRKSLAWSDKTMD